MNRCYQKSTIVSNTATSQVVSTNGELEFANTSISTGVSIKKENNEFKLSKSGLYLVIFNAFGLEYNTPGSVTVQLYKTVNNVKTPVVGAVGTYNSTTTSDVGNVSFSTIIEVAPSCNCVNNSALLTFINEGVVANYGNVNVVIEKIA